ncbi:protein containing Prepilin-type cleavage/methylation [Candidatus Velamenicoccus archaeovorus]|uniref:Protein containing Prepilin-type cleavage/methylation n=1 Tax=Velamenicoccus archaeovorus TaxID=1930593 RepID=A0A410P5A0_VELA1|nr:prepilin-type N-terminal cleavage/methylation domain-containing protein [Candidatus Velamenicoccus archaeovorus]QAT17375.1 protein containing Prepilin-type cleavage/methylation [Candidatus Velamenicoccus archaeovorus]
MERKDFFDRADSPGSGLEGRGGDERGGAAAVSCVGAGREKRLSSPEKKLRVPGSVSSFLCFLPMSRKKTEASRRYPAGFTLIEVVLALAILAVTLSGLLLTYVSMFVLTDMQRDHALASNSLLARLEEIRAMDFDSIPAAAGPFNLTDYGFPANRSSRGRVEVTTSFSGYPATLTKVRLVASYATRLNRTVGEDRNFNGALDVGEDVNNNSRLDSSAEVVSLVAK